MELQSTGRRCIGTDGPAMATRVTATRVTATRQTATRQTAIGLVLAMVLAGGNDGFCVSVFGGTLIRQAETNRPNEQAGDQTSGASVQTATTSTDTDDYPRSDDDSPGEQEAAPYSGPVEILSAGRFEINFKQLRRLSELGHTVVGNSDWGEGGMLMDIVESIDELSSDNAAAQPLDELSIEILLATKPNTFELVGGFQLMVFSLPVADVMVLSEEELPTGSDFDGDGFAVIDDSTTLLDGGDYCVWVQGGPRQELAREHMIRALERHQKMPPQKACEYTFEPPQVSQRVRNLLKTMAISGLSTMAQRRDQEAELPFRLREFGVKPLMAATDLLSDQLQSLAYSVHLNSESQQVQIEFCLKAIAGSQFEHWLLRQSEARNRTSKFLHPDHDTVCSMCLALPDVVRTCLPLLSKAALEACVAEGLLSRSSADQCQVSLQDMSDRGVIELLLQVIPVDDGAFDIALTQPLPQQNDLTAAAIELVSANADAWITAFTDIDGWPVHKAADVFGMQGRLDSGILWPSDLLFCATDAALHMQLTQPEGSGVLSSIVRHEFEELPDRPAVGSSPVYLRANCQQWLQRLDERSSSQDYFPDVAAGRGQSTGRSDVIVVGTAAAGELRLTAKFEHDASAFGISLFEVLFTNIFEYLDL